MPSQGCKGLLRLRKEELRQRVAPNRTLGECEICEERDCLGLEMQRLEMAILVTGRIAEQT
ncbi:MAG: hypothetical protein NVS2B16_11990 [Chloroflexota bacterium]